MVNAHAHAHCCNSPDIPETSYVSLNEDQSRAESSRAASPSHSLDHGDVHRPGGIGVPRHAA